MQEKILKSRARVLKYDDKCTLEFSIKLPKQLAALLIENPIEEDTTPKPVEDDDDDDWEDKPSQAEREEFQARCRPSRKNASEMLTQMMDEKFNSVIVIGGTKRGPVTVGWIGLSPQLALELLDDAICTVLHDEDFYK